MSDNYVTKEQFDKFLQEGTVRHMRDEELARRAEESAIERGAQLSELLRRQNIMQVAVDSITKWRPGVDQRLEKYNKMLYGNGEPGIDEVMREVLRYIKERKEQEQAAWTDAKKFALGALAFIVNTILAIWISGIVK